MLSKVFATNVKCDRTCVSTATWIKRVGLILLSVVIMIGIGLLVQDYMVAK